MLDSSCVSFVVPQILGHGCFCSAVSARSHLVFWALLHQRGLDCYGVPLHHIQHLPRNVYLHFPLPSPEKSKLSLCTAYGFSLSRWKAEGFWAVKAKPSAEFTDADIKNKHCLILLLVKSYVKSTLYLNTWLFACVGPQRVQQVLPPHVLLRRAADWELARFCEDFHHTDQRTLLLWHTGTPALLHSESLATRQGKMRARRILDSSCSSVTLLITPLFKRLLRKMYFYCEHRKKAHSAS